MLDFVESRVKQFWLGCHLYWVPVRELIEQEVNEEKADLLKKQFNIKIGQFNHKGAYKVLELEKKTTEDKYKQREFLEDLYKKNEGKKRL